MIKSPLEGGDLFIAGKRLGANLGPVEASRIITRQMPMAIWRLLSFVSQV